MRDHEISHTGEKNFQCEICRKGFSFKANLNAHMITHATEKPYICDTCGKSFKRKANLEKVTLMKNHMYAIIVENVSGKNLL